MKKMGRIRVEEAAKRACVSGETIRLWCRSERVKAVLYGHVWWVDAGSLDKLLEGVLHA